MTNNGQSAIYRYMQRTEFGQDIPKSGGNFIRVKNTNDKVTFRLAQPPVHTGKHFLTDPEGKWNVIGCPRINEGETCEYCEDFFNLMKLAKEADAKGDKAAAEQLKKDARADGKQVAIQFFYPVLNRDTHTFGILQTTYGIKQDIDAKFNNGVKVTERDMVLTNTGKPGAARYALDVVDSADSAPLTPEEEAEYKKAQEYDMMKLSNGESEEVDVPADFGEKQEKTEEVKNAEKIFAPEQGGGWDPEKTDNANS